MSLSFEGVAFGNPDSLLRRVVFDLRRNVHLIHQLIFLDLEFNFRSAFPKRNNVQSLFGEFKSRLSKYGFDLPQ
mgnify:CR=1 FL=1